MAVCVGLFSAGTGLAQESDAKDPAYQQLQRALEAHQKLAKKQEGGWPSIPPGPKIEPGEQGPRVAVLRARLMVTDSAKQLKSRQPDLYDEALVAAVKRFQERHGIDPDGTIGPSTLVALNVSLEQRTHQIERNLVRWGERPGLMEGRYVAVNIPDYTLSLMEGDKPQLTMRVVVGMRNWQTPIFHAQMTHIVFNPRWHVPTKIAVKEVIPDIKKDPNYLAKKGMRVLTNQDGKVQEVDPATIDWEDAAQWRQYTFHQDSGAGNALGRVKFLFPNQYDVYLHDTPSKSFFQRSARALSHGCIRVQKPLDLAVAILGQEPNPWTEERIKAAINRGTEQFVKLTNTLPVYLYYQTAWVDAAGVMQFRNDIYGLDK